MPDENFCQYTCFVICGAVKTAPYIATNPTYQYADFCEAYPPFERGRADAECNGALEGDSRRGQTTSYKQRLYGHKLIVIDLHIQEILFHI